MEEKFLCLTVQYSIGLGSVAITFHVACHEVNDRSRPGDRTCDLDRPLAPPRKFLRPEIVATSPAFFATS